MHEPLRPQAEAVMNEARKRLLSVTFFGLVVVFLVIYLNSIDYSQLSRLTLDWSLLLLATFFAIVFRYWGVYIWRVILRELGSTSLPRFKVMSTVYAKAWMGRYIPGKVTWIAGKIYLANALGISRSRLAVSALLEGGMQIVALFSVSLLLLGLDPRLGVISSGPKFVMVGVAVLCLLILNPRIFNPLMRKAYVVIRKQEPTPELTINGKAVFKSFYLYSIGAFLSGTSFFLLAKAVDPIISLDLYLYCIGAYNLAGALGMATPLLPSGIGVRDGVLLVLLTIVLPAEIALALTVLSRLWSAAVDLLFYVLSVINLRNRSMPVN
jgi:hypothetical protein